MAGLSLPEFLRRASRTGFIWGTHDCALYLADWIVEVRGVDPAAHLRGRYASELGCARLLARAGGLEALVGACLAGVGIGRTDAPQLGDVALVAAPTPRGERPCGAICTGPRWAMLGARGLISAPAVPLAAWRVA